VSKHVGGYVGGELPCDSDAAEDAPEAGYRPRPANRGKNETIRAGVHNRIALRTQQIDRFAGERTKASPRLSSLKSRGTPQEIDFPPSEARHFPGSPTAEC